MTRDNQFIFYLGAVILLFFRAAASAEDLPAFKGSLLSPDGTLEVYKLPEFIDTDVNGQSIPSGTKLFVRQKSSTKGTLLLENNRWMAVQWASYANLLAVEDHWDGHASVVYVFGFKIKPNGGVASEIKFKSPDNGYDVQWYFEGWSKDHNQITLRKEQILHPKDSSGRLDASTNLGKTSKNFTFLIPN